MTRMWSGEIAKAARLRAGFASPGQAADRLGVHQASVYAWEAGREPRVIHLAALAQLYGITMDSLFVVHDGSNGDAPSALERNRK